MNETTPEHADQFEAAIAHWQSRLNLHDWRICRGAKPARGAMADMQIDVGARLAIWRIGKSWGMEPVTAQSISATACHELLHVLLADLTTSIELKASPDLIESAEHRIINTLERLLVPQTPNE